MAEAKTKTAQKAAPKKAPAAKPAATKKSIANAALADAPAKTAKSAAKPVAKPAAKRAAPAKKSAATEWNPGNEERYNMIQVAAYYLAERDGFAGSPVEYWIAAESQVSSMLPKR